MAFRNVMDEGALGRWSENGLLIGIIFGMVRG
jgi:hypothetical protein